MKRSLLLVVLVACSATQAAAQAFNFMEITGGAPNVLPRGTGRNASLLQERPIRPGDSFQFTAPVTIIPDENGDFSLTDIEVRASRLMPFNFGPCTEKIQDLWIPCFLASVRELPIDPTFRDIPLPLSATFDPIAEVVSGSFSMTATGLAWSFQTVGKVNGREQRSNEYWVMPAALNVPEPSSFVLLFSFLCLITTRRVVP